MTGPLTGQADLRPLPWRYLLVTVSVPIFEDAQGVRYLDPMWAKDLQAHLVYLPGLVLACPVRRDVVPANSVRLDALPWFAGIEHVALPASLSFVQALLNLPSLAWRLARAIRAADVVQTAVAGWPLPGAWAVLPLASLMRKPVVVNVESAFWRIPAGAVAGPWARAKAAVYEGLNRWCVRRSDLAFFTHESYKETLLGRGEQQGHVIQASWIDDDKVLSEAAVHQRWQALPPGAPLRLLFAGRLLREKGLMPLLEAVSQLSQRGVVVQLDILGEGAFEQPCRDAVKELGLTQVRFIGTVPYGPAFFSLLGQYQALVVPSLSDEQPRIIYDAYSQGVPVIGSRTKGIAQCVQDGQTGCLTDPGDVAQLVERIQWVDAHRELWAQMASAALGVARGMTHEHMHRQKWALMQGLLDRARP